MMRKDGAEQLQDFTTRSFAEKITRITPEIWHVLGMGHSNAIFIEGAQSVILIDTLDTLERGQRLSALIRAKTGKPVRTILYTHSHPDHRGGAGAFCQENPEIIAFAPKTPPLGRTELLSDIQNLRGSRQFGYTLSDTENISQGIGIREGITRGEKRAFLPPTTLYHEDRVVRKIDGIRLELVRLPGESDDQIMVWLPDQEVLCCGDNYYGCWPNLYAIRGGQYRDLVAWIESLDTLRSYPARYLLPGHTAPLIGREEIESVLANFRGAIDEIVTNTLLGMNEGKSADELAEEIRLSPQYAQLPYLGEFYGSIDWTVRAIYTAYLGWFDGNPTHLHPLPRQQHARKTIQLMGGIEAVWQAAQQAGEQADFQWCLELCDLLAGCAEQKGEIYRLKAAALTQLAEQETSANGRHYYLSCAHQLRRAAKRE